MRLAVRHVGQIDLADAEVDFQQIDVDQRDEYLADVDEVTDADRAQTDHAVERREDAGFVEARARQLQRGVVGFELCLGAILHFDRCGFFFDEQFCALVRELGDLAICGFFRDFRAVHRVVERDQRGAFFDLLAFAEADGDDASGDLGTDRHRLVRAQRADRFDRATDDAEYDRRDLDDRRRHLIAAGGCLLRGTAAMSVPVQTRNGENEQRNGHDPGLHRVQACKVVGRRHYMPNPTELRQLQWLRSGTERSQRTASTCTSPKQVRRAAGSSCCATVFRSRGTRGATS